SGRRRESARGRGRDVGPAAPGRASLRARSGPARGGRLAGPARWQPRGPGFRRCPRRTAARGAVPACGRPRGRRGTAQRGARALRRMDGAAPMTALAWPAFAGFAWPWWLLALPLPWLARALLPPARSPG